MTEKFESRAVRLGDFLRVAIPPEISADVDLMDQSTVSVFINDQGNIEIEVQRQGKKSSKTVCAVCNHFEAKRKCINCGRHVCTKCFWAFGSLCKKCAKKI